MPQRAKAKDHQAAQQKRARMKTSSSVPYFVPADGGGAEALDVRREALHARRLHHQHLRSARLREDDACTAALGDARGRFQTP